MLLTKPATKLAAIEERIRSLRDERARALSVADAAKAAYGGADESTEPTAFAAAKAAKDAVKRGRRRDRERRRGAGRSCCASSATRRPVLAGFSSPDRERLGTRPLIGSRGARERVARRCASA